MQKRLTLRKVLSHRKVQFFDKKIKVCQYFPLTQSVKQLSVFALRRRVKYLQIYNGIGIFFDGVIDNTDAEMASKEMQTWPRPAAGVNLQ